MGNFFFSFFKRKKSERQTECNIRTQEKEEYLEKQQCQKEEEGQSKWSNGCQIILAVFHSTIFFPLLFSQTPLPVQTSMTVLFSHTHAESCLMTVCCTSSN